MDLNIVIAGKAGQGLKTITTILDKTFFKMGLNLYSSKNYMSRIRGGHNFMKIRISDRELFGPQLEQDILLALDKESIDIHKESLSEDGTIIFDGDSDNEKVVKIEAKDVSKDLGNIKVANSVFVGSLMKLLRLEIDICKDVFNEYFNDKSDEIKDINIKALEKGYEIVDSKYNVSIENNTENTIMINGNNAVGYGAVAAGVKFYSAYPMTPATGILNYLAGKQDEMGIVVEQAEDELAAINMALGAYYGGIRSMTGTSGGGFALMNEAISLAGITEIPLVLAEVQRPGPATGLPTRTAQGDLLFAVNSGHGDFPIMVISPKDAKDAFYQTFRAFNIAENYQMVVIILSDQFLADSTKNFKEFDIDSLEIKRGFLDNNKLSENYKRYEITQSGISPLTYPGASDEAIVTVDSDEHDENGHIIEDAETRVAMVDKRNRKIEKLIQEEIKEPEYFGDDEPDLVLTCFGSTYGPLREALQLLNDAEHKVGVLAFSDVYPLPTEKITEFSKKNIDIVSVENNSTGQFAKLIRMETGITVKQSILNYDGREFDGKSIYNRVIEEVIS